MTTSDTLTLSQAAKLVGMTPQGFNTEKRLAPLRELGSEVEGLGKTWKIQKEHLIATGLLDKNGNPTAPKSRRGRKPASAAVATEFATEDLDELRAAIDAAEKDKAAATEFRDEARNRAREAHRAAKVADDEVAQYDANVAKATATIRAAEKRIKWVEKNAERIATARANEARRLAEKAAQEQAEAAERAKAAKAAADAAQKALEKLQKQSQPE